MPPRSSGCSWFRGTFVQEPNAVCGIPKVKAQRTNFIEIEQKTRIVDMVQNWSLNSSLQYLSADGIDWKTDEVIRIFRTENSCGQLRQFHGNPFSEISSLDFEHLKDASLCFAATVAERAQQQINNFVSQLLTEALPPTVRMRLWGKWMNALRNTRGVCEPL